MSVLRVCQPLRSIDSKADSRGVRRDHNDDLLPMSPSFLSSKSRKRLRVDISCKRAIVFFDQSSMISAWVLRTQMWAPISSAILRRS